MEIGQGASTAVAGGDARAESTAGDHGHGVDGVHHVGLARHQQFRVGDAKVCIYIFLICAIYFYPFTDGFCLLH